MTRNVGFWSQFLGLAFFCLLREKLSFGKKEEKRDRRVTTQTRGTDTHKRAHIMSSSKATKLASERRRWWALAKRAQMMNLLGKKGGGKGMPTVPNPDPKKREIHFPNLHLRLVAPTEEARMRGIEVATFITTPNVTKTEIKTFLTDVHGIEVLKVDTANYEGKKKRNLERGNLFRKPDYKKVYVTLGQRWFPPERFCVPSK